MSTAPDRIEHKLSRYQDSKVDTAIGWARLIAEIGIIVLLIVLSGRLKVPSYEVLGQVIAVNNTIQEAQKANVELIEDNNALIKKHNEEVSERMSLLEQRVEFLEQRMTVLEDTYVISFDDRGKPRIHYPVTKD